MAYRLEITDSANRDLDGILTYLCENLRNPSAASRLVDSLEKKYDLLEQQPLMCEPSRDPQLAAKGYRRLVIDNYLALYLVDSGTQTVTIARIFYGRRDYAKYL